MPRARVAGHFGELLQGRLGPSGPVALVTLPCPALGVTARLAPGRGFVLHDPGRLLGRAQARALARALTGRAPSGRLALRAEMPAGGGAGASTAARLAAAGVLAAAAGRRPRAERLAALCLALEGATDPLMQPAPAACLWASREARALEALPPLPALDVVGGFHGPTCATDPGDARFADIADLAAAWAPAAAAGDRARLAALATESARRNAALRPGPALAPVEAAARAHGALGVAAAHTGPARALLFAPGEGDPAGAAAALRAAGLSRVIRFRAA